MRRCYSYCPFTVYRDIDWRGQKDMIIGERKTFSWVHILPALVFDPYVVTVPEVIFAVLEPELSLA